MVTKHINLKPLRIIFLIFLISAFSLDVIILLTNCANHIFYKVFTLTVDYSEENFPRLFINLLTVLSLVFYIFNFLINYILVIVISSIFSYSCKYLNNGYLTHSVGWTIGYFFIPIVSYFKPYQALKEFYFISQSDNTNNSPFTKNILIWWILFLITSISIRVIGDFEKIALLPVDIIILINILQLYFFYLSFDTIFKGIIYRFSSIEKLETEIETAF
jgi:hypothetical protein